MDTYPFVYFRNKIASKVILCLLLDYIFGYYFFIIVQVFCLNVMENCSNI